MKTILIGACSDLGVHHNGTKNGPIEILKDYKDKIMLYQNENYIKSLDKKDLRKNLEELNIFNQKLYQIIDKEIKKGNIPLTIGGDHSISISSALASRNNNNIGIIWIDAHTDFNTFETTTTGNIHGLPLATITGYKNQILRTFGNNTINPKNAVIIGARSIDSLEYDNLNNAGITYYTTKDIYKYGIQKIVEKSILIASNNTEGIHISCDLDIIDPSFAPGVSVPELNGITDKDILKITKEILKFKNLIKSYDLVELNPDKDINNKTLKIANTLLKTIKSSLEN